jgi:hypothetical protein
MSTGKFTTRFIERDSDIRLGPSGLGAHKGHAENGYENYNLFGGAAPME